MSKFPQGLGLDLPNALRRDLVLVGHLAQLQLWTLQPPGPNDHLFSRRQAPHRALDLIVEGEFIRSFEPNDGFSAGANFMARYNLLSWSKLVPFAEAGTGIGYLDFGLFDQEDGIIFYPQVGLGFHYFLTELFSLDTSLRFHHISNAGTDQPNNGVHSGLVLLGLTFYLD